MDTDNEFDGLPEAIVPEEHEEAYMAALLERDVPAETLEDALLAGEMTQLVNHHLPPWAEDMRDALGDWITEAEGYGDDAPEAPRLVANWVDQNLEASTFSEVAAIPDLPYLAESCRRILTREGLFLAKEGWEQAAPNLRRLADWLENWERTHVFTCQDGCIP